MVIRKRIIPGELDSPELSFGTIRKLPELQVEHGSTTTCETSPFTSAESEEEGWQVGIVLRNKDG